MTAPHQNVTRLQHLPSVAGHEVHNGFLPVLLLLLDAAAALNVQCGQSPTLPHDSADVVHVQGWRSPWGGPVGDVLEPQRQLGTLRDGALWGSRAGQWGWINQSMNPFI